MNACSFAEYAASSDLTTDETYTVELLIDKVRDNFDPDFWDTWSERVDAREAPDYKPAFSKDHIQPATKELQDLSWVSFQRQRDSDRPVRDLGALRYFPRITELVLTNSEVLDLSPLGNCADLRRLHLRKNPIREITPLAGCANLEELDLSETPIEDFTAIQTLPKLRQLSISVDQLPVFRRLNRLPALQKLELGSGVFDSFEGFPEMPELRSIQGATVQSLNGIQQFSKLQSLVNLFGEFDSLEPLRGTKSLTHANILSSRVDSLQPLSGLSTLRYLRLATDVVNLELSPLEGLPALHEVTVKCSGKEAEGIACLRTQLEPWDIEFRSEKPRHMPSLEIQIVSQETFDYYDTKMAFNRTDSDTNEALLSSELEWLDGQLEELFAVDFETDEDFSIPFRWNGARSRTVVLLSDHAVEAFPQLVLGMQKILSHSKNDWIIYFQSDGTQTEFIVWVYAEKILVTESYAETIQKLITPN